MLTKWHVQENSKKHNSQLHITNNLNDHISENEWTTIFEYNRILYSHENEQTINNDSLKINIKRKKPDTKVHGDGSIQNQSKRSMWCQRSEEQLCLGG